MDNSKKVGILSLYYNNMNYGGVLQAYALCKVLNNMGVRAEQIQIRRVFHCVPHRRTFSDYLNPNKYIQKAKLFIAPHIEKKHKRLHEQEWNERDSAVKRFRDVIPHSDRVYTDDDISEAVDSYDVFVAGSDQVWGITQFTSPYLMNFVPKGKSKFSYAASMGYTSIDESTKKVYEQTFKSYKAISVRESDAVEMLAPLTDKPVIQTLDPTLLLEKEQWDEIATERKITEHYLLCYFLGDDKKLRKLATEFAKAKGLKIVTFPHCPAVHHKSDGRFGDYQVFSAGPDDFISYIKYCDYVFTDSFHGAVFSLIYQKQFTVFNRKGEERMISRIYSLMDIFETRERMVSDFSTVKLNDIINIIEKDVRISQNVINGHIQDSINFLRENLE